jgi:hypothetical protein
LLRRHRQQALDGVARAVHGTRLDRLGDGVQRHHHRGFRPLADREGARHGHGHQRVDVQPPVAQRRQTLLVDVEAGSQMAMAATASPAPRQTMRLRREVADDLGADGQEKRPGQLGDLASHDLVIMTVAHRMAGL